MARFSVYRNAEGDGLLLDVQADLLSHLNTRIVVPLLPLVDAPIPAGTLNPVFEIDGNQLVMVTQFMAAIPASLLKTTLCSLERERDKITLALNLLFQGF